MTSPNASTTYDARRAWVAEYFDRTAAAQWTTLTREALDPASLGRVRRTVRAGRELMRGTLLSWLPRRMDGLRVLDAGCGTGMLAMALARRGATVVAVDVAAAAIDVARERTPASLAASIAYVVGDMLDASFGTFDHVVAMDSLLHYRSDDIVRAVARLAERTRGSIAFTVAPRTPALAVMHAVGRLVPTRTGSRAPAIEPVGLSALRARLAATPETTRWQEARSRRIANGFYTSHAIALRSPTA